MNQSRRYLNQGRKRAAGDESLLDLLIQHYDELNRLIVLTAEGLEPGKPTSDEKLSRSLAATR